VAAVKTAQYPSTQSTANKEETNKEETNKLQKACVIIFSTAYANKVEASERGSGY